MKVTIRSVISDLVGRNRKETRKEIENLEAVINDMHALKIKGNKINETERREDMIQLSNTTINSMEED